MACALQVVDVKEVMHIACSAFMVCVCAGHPVTVLLYALDTYLAEWVTLEDEGPGSYPPVCPV